MNPDAALPDEPRARLRRQLEDLARNFRWVWDVPTQQLFARVSVDGWEVGHRSPLQLLADLEESTWRDLAADADFVRDADHLHAELLAYVQPGRPPRAPQVAYFSPEFGVAESLPQYSGGLGVLAGDHLKAASDLDLSLVGVGLFYRQGFFRQELVPGQGQLEHYRDIRPEMVGLQKVHGAAATVAVGDENVAVQVWKADVGRITLLLLDTHVDGNSERARHITDRLYGGDQAHRVRQELILGVAGVRVLRSLGMAPRVYHLNEGHAGFLALERIRAQMVSSGASLHEAVEQNRASLVFTTHTPVPAGIDRFPRDLMQTYLGGWCEGVGVSIDELMELGRYADDGPDAFNMAAFCLRVSGRANGVSQLHGAVSRSMFASVFPDTPERDVPITAVTNGVHARTWTSPEVQAIFDRVIGVDWPDASADDWRAVSALGDDELRDARVAARERLVRFVRDRLAERGQTHAAEALDPGALTIGFARRFATYKRATLLLSDRDRLERLLLDGDRPVQVVFAGKAHPADEPGKALLRQVLEVSADPTFAGRFVFIDDYDIGVARALYHGSDVWLNNPVRPQEACGTSGEKAALNGALNFSVLDGWWAEMYDGGNGWSIPSFEEFEDRVTRDAAEVGVLYDVLENEIVPLFYADGRPLSSRWLDRVRHTWASLGPQVTASRMVRDYQDRLYRPIPGRPY
ncbi:alpha-glucan family phosphorylase [Actinomarinicola tropica]|uniref:alpha-glucan family phosphorylase n=1 Tax=Actinomarinicola tropica TaxID=2789776 RepID=UPI0018984091|nr:alpha-glucan family phosphorylase [Actinomarinicola tropica]